MGDSLFILILAVCGGVEEETPSYQDRHIRELAKKLP